MTAASGVSLSSSISLTDLIQADKTRDIPTICGVMARYLQSRPQENFATVEGLFRNNHCWTHLIAKKVDPKHPYNPPVFRDIPRTYELFISTQDPEIAAAELAHYAGNEATNLSRLPDAGCYFLRKPTDLFDIVDKVGGAMRITSDGMKALAKELS